MVAFRGIRGCGPEESARCDVLCHCRAAHCPMRLASCNTFNSQTTLELASLDSLLLNTRLQNTWHAWGVGLAQPFKSVNITGSYHVQIPTGALIEIFQTCSAMHGGCLVTPSTRRSTLRLASRKAGTDTLSAASSPSSLFCATSLRISMVIPCVFLGWRRLRDDRQR